jgi:hypothetical protein
LHIFTEEFQPMYLRERAHLEQFLTALGATPRALTRDDDDPVIDGKLGHIYADGPGYLLAVVAKDERDQSPRRWTNVKNRLDFCAVLVDGYDEGLLHLGRLPTPDEAPLIREALGIRRKRQLSDEAKAALIERLRQAA